MSRGQRTNANDVQFKEYRDLAPVAVEDSKIRFLMKEHGSKKDKINEVISGWWDKLPASNESEEWVTTTKTKKVVPQSQSDSQNVSDRNSGGRGRSVRGVTSGGRGSGVRPSTNTTNTGRSSSPRGVVNGAVAVSAPSAIVTDAAIVNDIPVVSASTNSGSGTNAWGQKSLSLTDTPTSAEVVPATNASSSSKTSNNTKKSDTKAAVSAVVSAPSFPAATSGSMWNSVETAAQRIKRLENEKNKPKPVPVVVEEKAVAIATNATDSVAKQPSDSTSSKPSSGAIGNDTKGQKKKRNTRDRAKPTNASAPLATEDAPTDSLSETKSLLENLASIEESVSTLPVPPVSKSDTTDAVSNVIETVDSSPKIGLKMGKWETKAERIEAPSLSFGSFGNAATNLVSEDTPPASSTSAWGSSTSASSANDVSGTGAVWSNSNPQSNTTSDILKQSDNNSGSNSQQQSPSSVFEQQKSNDAPPGLGSQGKPHTRSAPGQSRNKQDNNGQNAQQMQQQNGYQQAPGFGRGGQNAMPPSNNMLYGHPQTGFDYQNMQPFQHAAPSMTPSSTSGPGASNTNTNAPGANTSTGSATTAPIQPQQQGQQQQQVNQQQQQQVQQPYAQPPGMNSGYYQNPYYGYQNMAPFNYYGQGAVPGGYGHYGHNQGGRGYQGGRGGQGQGGYADQYNPNVLYSGDNFNQAPGQFNDSSNYSSGQPNANSANGTNPAGNNGNNQAANSNHNTNNKKNSAATPDQSQQNSGLGQVQQQQYGYVNPYNAAAPGGWGGYPGNAGYGAQMYPGQSQLGGQTGGQMFQQPQAQNGNRDNQQRNNGGYGNNRPASTSTTAGDVSSGTGGQGQNQAPSNSGNYWGSR